MPSCNQILEQGHWQQIINEKETAAMALRGAGTSLATSGYRSKSVKLDDALTADETSLLLLLSTE